MRGLTVDDDGFEAWRRELEAGNRALLPEAPRRDARNHGFQNTVVHVRDQYGVGVDDHLLEFYEDDHDRGDLVARLFHESAIRKVHKYSGNASYRSVYVDCTRLARTIDKVHEALSLSITAYPELDERTPVGFTTLGSGGRGGVRIPRDAIARFFAAPPHRAGHPAAHPAAVGGDVPVPGASGVGVLRRRTVQTPGRAGWAASGAAGDALRARRRSAAADRFERMSRRFLSKTPPRARQAGTDVPVRRVSQPQKNLIVATRRAATARTMPAMNNRRARRGSRGVSSAANSRIMSETLPP